MSTLKFQTIFTRVHLRVIGLSFFFVLSLSAQGQSAADYSTAPVNLRGSAATNQVLLTMSNDHQLYFKAYSDHINLDEDPNDIIETTYANTIRYDGYFDPDLCYIYGAGVFSVSPSHSIQRETIAGGTAASVNRADLSNKNLNRLIQRANAYCDGSTWSGNFLNWVSMTRIDIVRKVLYGGYRSSDTETLTVLERSYLPNDGHSFAKYYVGNDIDKLTPFTVDLSNSNKRKRGLTFCNTTYDPTPNIRSQQSKAPPLLRVVRGNYSRWASGQRYQCLYDSNDGLDNRGRVINGAREFPLNPWDLGRGAGPERTGNNGVDGAAKNLGMGAGYDALDAYARSPIKAEVGGQDFIVRVRVCDDIVPESRCGEYTNGSLKPEGVLQKYGSGNLDWGLMTGSITKNKSGGVLRKNIGSIADEINLDGTFKKPAVPSPQGSIIATLDAFRIVDYTFKSDVPPGRRRNNNNPNGLWPNDAWGTYLLHDNCRYGSVAFNDGNCKNWGNPFSEIMLESYRYFSGVQDGTANYRGSNEYRTNDSAIVPQLVEVIWKSPVDESTACAKLNILAFNASTSSFDGDNIANLVKFNPAAPRPNDAFAQGTFAQVTDKIGAREGLYVGEYITPAVPVDPANPTACASGVLTNLSQVSGTCPDAPRLKGTYLMAGMADKASKSDVNPVEGIQNVATWGVALAPASPRLELTVNNTDVMIIPACLNTSNTDVSANCAIIDFKIVDNDLSDGQVAAYVNWEDTEQGGDFDADVNGIIKATVKGSNVLVETKVTGESASLSLGFGFVISGVSRIEKVFGEADAVAKAAAAGFAPNPVGIHILSGVNHYSGSWCPPVVNRRGQRIGGCIVSDANPARADDDLGLGDGVGMGSGLPAAGVNRVNDFVPANYSDNGWGSIEFSVDNATRPAELLHQPLYYAAKYGDPSGRPAKDQAPDNYFIAENPSKLKSGIEQMISQFVAVSGAASGTGDVSNAGSAAGLSIQTYYEPEYPSGNKSGVSKIRWLGSVNALFLDEDGLVREDTNGDSNLTKDDFVVETYIDGDELKIKRRSLKDYKNNGNSMNGLAPVDFSSLRPVWSARDRLNDFVAATAGQQRAYTISDTQKRHILTGQLTSPPADGEVVNANALQLTDFLASSFTGVNAAQLRFLDLPAVYNTEEFVNYIRGFEKKLPAGASDADKAALDDYHKIYRSRSTTYPLFGNGRGLGDQWLLGDIINSKPALVAGPEQLYDVRFSDTSYRQFKLDNEQRRTVVYVGANDGMIHAFNAGFCKPKAQGTGAVDDPRAFGVECTRSKNGTTAYKLGEELWAYVPFNLLPHLKWLADENYPHVSYMDGEVRVYDAKIGSAGGKKQWRTILVAGMRLGGGDYSVKRVAGDDDTDVVLRSAYVILDITDPEVPPKLIGEVTHADLGHTVGGAELVRDGNKDKWYLAFGSGPRGDGTLAGSQRARNEFISTESAKVFMLDLTLNPANKLANDTLSEITIPGIYGQLGFVGGVNGVDLNVDYEDDVLYVGVVQGDSETQGGSVQRIPLNLGAAELMGAPSPLFGAGGDAPLATKEYTMADGSIQRMGGTPFFQSPRAIILAGGQPWVFAASGRVLSKEDALAQNVREGVWGVREELSYTDQVIDMTAQRNDFVNITNVASLRNGDIRLKNNLTAKDFNVDGCTITDGSRKQLTECIASKHGWYLPFDQNRSYQRVNTPLAFGISALNFATYKYDGQSANVCETGAQSSIYQRDITTGIPPVYSPFIEDNPVVVDNNNGVTIEEQVHKDSVLVDPGRGIVTEVSSRGDGSLSSVDKVKAGPIVLDKESRRQGWRELFELF